MSAHSPYVEVNVDCLAGPSHHYGGHAFGNLASMQSKKQLSYPRAAALQGLEKAKLCMDLGIPQIVLPPQQRPALDVLWQLGFRGTDEQIIECAFQEAPKLLSACYSSSWMWTANWATVTPSPDSFDGRLHLTPANLVSQFHRALEVPQTLDALRRVFSNRQFFEVHDCLPCNWALADEGAANHTRFCSVYGQPGLHLLVYGREGWSEQEVKGLQTEFPARQSRLASECIARQHGLRCDRVVYARTSSKAIDLGVFHNDVASVGNQQFFLYHAHAFENTGRVIDALKRCAEGLQLDLFCFKVSEEAMSLKEAVKSYLFNSQILTLPTNEMVIIAPSQCQEMPKAKQVLDELIAGNSPIRDVRYVDLRQSMQNGGGPACLRLRVVMSQEQMGALPQGILLTPRRYETIKKWITTHYREELKFEDLRDPELMKESNSALESFSTSEFSC